MQEQRWRECLDFELAAIVEERRRLDEMEKLLLNDFQRKAKPFILV